MTQEQIEKLLDVLEFINGRLDAVNESVGGVNFGTGEKKIRALHDSFYPENEE